MVKIPVNVKPLNFIPEEIVFFKSFIKSYTIEVSVPVQHLKYYLDEQLKSNPRFDYFVPNTKYVTKFITDLFNEEFINALDLYHEIRDYNTIFSAYKYEDPLYVSLTKIHIGDQGVNYEINDKDIFENLKNEKELKIYTKFAVYSPIKDLLFKDYTKIKVGNFITRVIQDMEIKPALIIPPYKSIKGPQKEVKTYIQFEDMDVIKLYESKKDIIITNISNKDLILIEK